MRPRSLDLSRRLQVVRQCMLSNRSRLNLPRLRSESLSEPLPDVAEEPALLHLVDGRVGRHYRVFFSTREVLEDARLEVYEQFVAGLDLARVIDLNREEATIEAVPVEYVRERQRHDGHHIVVLDGVYGLLPRAAAPEIVGRDDDALLVRAARRLERRVVILEGVVGEELLVPALLQQIRRDYVVGIDVVAVLLCNLAPELQIIHSPRYLRG